MRVAVCARFSTTLQDARSIEDQLSPLGRFAKERGWTVAAEFSDAAQSGATLERSGETSGRGAIKRFGPKLAQPSTEPGTPRQAAGFVGRPSGLEPLTPGATVRCSTN